MKIKMVTDAPGGAITVLRSIISDLKDFSKKEEFDSEDFNSIISKMTSWLEHVHTFCIIEKRLEIEDYRDLNQRLHATIESWLRELSREKLLLLYQDGDDPEDGNTEEMSEEQLAHLILESSSDAPFCLLDITNRMLDI
jgi:hypothetical protein